MSICFKESTKILTDKGYIKIENLKKGDLIQTLKNGFVPVYQIGISTISNQASSIRIKDQLYLLCSFNYKEIFEDLVLTGSHSILVDTIPDSLINPVKGLLGNIYVTDDKYRLPVCLDPRSIVYKGLGQHNIYNIALENDNYCSNYGIYANGLLVESCSKMYLTELSKMKLKY